MTCYNSFKADEYAHQLGLEDEREMAVSSLCEDLHSQYLTDSMDNLGVSEAVHTYFSESIIDENDIPRLLVKALEEKNDKEFLRLAKMMATMTSEYVNDKLYDLSLDMSDD